MRICWTLNLLLAVVIKIFVTENEVLENDLELRKNIKVLCVYILCVYILYVCKVLHDDPFLHSLLFPDQYLTLFACMPAHRLSLEFIKPTYSEEMAVPSQYPSADTG